MVVDQQLAGPTRATEATLPRVLVVDDEDTVLFTIRGILELEGYLVSAVSSGEQALQLIRCQPFDLVLVDLQLENGINGLDIVRELRQHSPEAASIVLTGYASIDSAVRALREGAQNYLLKPCDVLELRTAVSLGLERSRLATQLRQRVRDLEQANETIRLLNLELEQRVARATAELRAQISARDEFMATVSHDLKSPLTFIKGIANLRRRRAERSAATEPLVNALEQIEASAGRMATQLDAIVDASRLQSGRPLELRRSPTDIVDLLRKAVEERRLTSDRHVFQLTSTTDQIIGNWDQVRLARVVDNLLDNAIKFSPRGGAIEVIVGTEADVAVLTIRDRGEGIPATDLPHVFEQFRRGQNVEGRIPGAGIGLYGVRQLINLHHGTITADSEIGVGTTFTIRLPREL